MSAAEQLAPQAPAPAAVPAAEAPTEAGNPTPPPPPSPSKSFSAVARREKALHRQREEIKAAQTALASERTQLETRMRELEQKYGTKPANPLEALSRYGWDYKAATEFALNDGQPTAEQIARSAVEQVDALKAQADKDRQDAAERAQKDRDAYAEQTTADFKSEISDFVTENAQTYELVNLYAAQEVVYATVEAFYQKTLAQGKPRVLSIKEATEMVEKHLEKHADAIRNAKKFKAPAQAGKEQPKPGTQQAQQSRTLSNGMTPSSPTLVTSAAIEDDRMRRALAALGG